MIPFVAQMAASTVIDKVFDKSAPKGGAGSEFRKYDQLDRQIGGDREDVVITIEESQIPSDQIKNSIGREVVTKETSMKSLYDSISNDNKKIIDALESSEKRINKNLENIAKGIEKVNKNVQKSATVSELYGKMGLQGAGRIGFGGNEKDGLTSAAGRIGELGAMILGGLGAIMGVLGLGKLVKNFGNSIAEWWSDGFSPEKRIDKNVDKVLEQLEGINNRLINTGDSTQAGGQQVEAQHNLDLAKDTGKVLKEETKNLRVYRKEAREGVELELKNRTSGIKDTKNQIKIITERQNAEIEEATRKFAEEKRSKGLGEITVSESEKIADEIKARYNENYLDSRNRNISQWENEKEILEKLYVKIKSVSKDMFAVKATGQAFIEAYMLLVIVTQDTKYLRPLYEELSNSKVYNSTALKIELDKYYNEREGKLDLARIDGSNPRYSETFYHIVMLMFKMLGTEFNFVTEDIYKNCQDAIQETLTDYTLSSFRVLLYNKSFEQQAEEFKYKAGLAQIGVLQNSGVYKLLEDEDELYGVNLNSNSAMSKQFRNMVVTEFKKTLTPSQFEDFVKSNKIKNPEDVDEVFKAIERIKQNALQDVLRSKDFKSWYKTTYGAEAGDQITSTNRDALIKYVDKQLSGSVDVKETDPEFYKMLAQSRANAWFGYDGTETTNQANLQKFSESSVTQSLFNLFNPNFKIKIGQDELSFKISKDGIDIAEIPKAGSYNIDNEEGPKAIISQDGSTSVTTP